MSYLTKKRINYRNCKKEPAECQCSPASETKEKFLTDVKTVNVVPHSLVPTFPESENSFFFQKRPHTRDKHHYSDK